jgi:hypothetical protein
MFDPALARDPGRKSRTPLGQSHAAIVGDAR